MAEIEFVDQTLRDGQQSLWGMRMRAGMIAPVAHEIDAAGYRVVDFTASSLFEVLLRYCHEDPWEGLDFVAGLFRRTPLRAASRSNCIAKFGLTPRSLMRLWVRTLVRHGIKSFWIYDCLYNMDWMRDLSQVAHDAGALVAPAVMFGLSPVHTDEWFAARVREMASWGCAETIYLEDAPGILTPERAATLVPALIEAARPLPLEMHCHNTTGLAPLNYLEAMRHGVAIFHTASQPLANGPSLPSIEAMLDNLRWLGLDTRIDAERLPAIARHFARVAERERLPVGVPNEYRLFPYQHQLPGGMTGTLRAQLAEHGMTDRLDEVLEEVVRVRAELGHPVSATPFSQLIGIQAVLNVVTGERYSAVPDEVIMYVLGHLGEPPAPIDEDVLDRILSGPRGRDFVHFVPPEPTLDELRQQYGGAHLSDEELLMRYLVPERDIAATRAAGPLKRSYEDDYEHDVVALLRRLAHSLRSDHFHTERPGLSVTIRRPGGPPLKSVD